MEKEDASGTGDVADSASEAVRGEVRLAGHRRVSHGLYLPLRPGLPPEQEFIRELKAWQLVLPEGAVFTHLTAARLRGWQLPKLPEHIPVFAAVSGNRSRPQRPGLIVSRLVRPSAGETFKGIPVDTAEEILLRAARDLGLLDLVVLVDSARRTGQVDARRMSEVLESGRPGVRMLTMAWSMSDPRADSGGETILRIFHVVIDVPVVPQAVLTDQSGHVIGQADLQVVGTMDLDEYDGDVHREKVQHRVDLRRERGLSDSAYRRHGYTLDDLLNFPTTVMHEIDRRLGRPHRMTRVRRWQRLVANSLYSDRGRERVLNRWRRQNGVIDWSNAA
jgi:hypothetical protein